MDCWRENVSFSRDQYPLNPRLCLVLSSHIHIWTSLSLLTNLWVRIHRHLLSPAFTPPLGVRFRQYCPSEANCIGHVPPSFQVFFAASLQLLMIWAGVRGVDVCGQLDNPRGPSQTQQRLKLKAWLTALASNTSLLS